MPKRRDFINTRIRLRDIDSISSALEDLFNETKAGKIDNKLARTLNQIAQTLLEGIQGRNQDKRLKELLEQLEEAKRFT